ncbi:MAG: glycerol-3-phosphate acyltransferase [Rhodobacterales bacterium]|nr:MAG: glycerol-3-phosphate acyltransferase [Rhodobacterales bacterium]
MTQSVTLPLWALLLILAFALVTFASHFLFPSVRWFFRKRAERAVAELNKRLVRPIEPFKLARRYDMIQELSYDGEVLEAVAAHAEAEGIPREVAFEQARRYAREIVPRFSAFAYFGFARWLTKRISRGFYKVQVDAFADSPLEKIDKAATVVFVMNHRSNIDYFLVTWLASDRSHLSYAVGEWARRWPLRGLIRAMGAYFIRRRSRNALYRKVLARYVQKATAGGVTQAVFPEGGLSLNGAVGEARLGLLNYMVEGYDPARGPDVVFIPVAINYDRVLEDRVLVAADIKGERKFRLRMGVLSRHIGKHIFERLTGRFHRFGYASVSLGAPVSLAEFRAGFTGDPAKLTQALGAELMGRIRAVVPVLPVPLVAAILHEAEGRSEAEIVQRFRELVAELEGRGAQVHVPDGDLDEAARTGLRLLEGRGILICEDGRYRVHAPDRPVLDFYANSIAHLSPALSGGSVLDVAT